MSSPCGLVMVCFRGMKFLESRERQGEMLSISGALIWSFFPVISILTFSTLPPLFSAGLSILFAALFFAVIITLRGKWYELAKKEAWKDILLATFIVGIVFYTLFFLGLKRTTAGNASIIGLTAIFFNFLILSLWKKEPFVRSHFFGAVAMIGGALFVLFPGTFAFRSGDFLILLACAIVPVGNYFSHHL